MRKEKSKCDPRYIVNKFIFGKNVVIWGISGGRRLVKGKIEKERGRVERHLSSFFPILILERKKSSGEDRRFQKKKDHRWSSGYDDSWGGLEAE